MLKKCLVIIYTLALASLWPQASLGQSIINAEEIIKEQSLLPYFSIFTDSSKKLTIHDITSESTQAKFEHKNLSPVLGYKEDATWLKLTITNNSDNKQELFIRHNNATTDFIDFYQRNSEGEWQRLVSGDRINFTSRPFYHSHTIFPLSLKGNTTEDIYLRVQSSGQQNIDLNISNFQGLLTATKRITAVIGFFFGGILILFIYNVIRYFNSPTPAIGYYLAYTLLALMFIAADHGLLFKWFWPNNPSIANSAIVLCLCLSQVFNLQCARHMLMLNAFSPILDKITRYIALLLLLNIFLMFVLNFGTSIIIGATLCLVSLVYLLVVGVVITGKGYKPSRYFVVGCSLMLTGFLLHILSQKGILPSYFSTISLIHVGILSYFMMLSFTLSLNIQEDSRYKYIDPVTHLYNRVYLFEQLEREFTIALHQEHTLCLILVSIAPSSKFKYRALPLKHNRHMRTAARSIEQILRKFHVACRFNQDEIAIILPNTPVNNARIIAERIKLVLSDNLHLKSSIGIASYSTISKFSNIHSANDLLEAADKAMYNAMTAGDNKIDIYFEDKDANAIN